MSNIPSNAPYRADIVGSFLRPAELKEARKQFTEGKIDRRQLKAVEDRLITDLIAKQKAHGLKVITDGEFRRSYWHLDFMWGFNGIEEIELEHGYQFHGEETTPGSIRLTGRISGENHPFVEHFRFVKQFEEEGITARQTLPAPAQLLAELYRGDNTKNTEAVYPDFDLLLHDIAEAYRQVIADLYAAGCRNIQFDDCTWGMIVDKDYWKAREGDHATLESEAEKYLKINNLALEGRPADIAFTTHICRGNYHSTYACRGLRPGGAVRLRTGECRCVLSGIRRRTFRRFRTAGIRAGRQESRTGTDYDQTAGAGGRSAGQGTHCRCRTVCRPRQPLPQSAVRLRFLRNRQQTDRGGTVGEDRPRAEDRRRRVEIKMPVETH